jgi:DNA-binding Lrp family transcriptional regulator
MLSCRRADTEDVQIENAVERWTFLTNHARVLVSIARSPSARVRDIAARVGITERQVLAIIHDLETGGYLSRERVGRRNHYRVHHGARFRHAFEGSVSIGALIDLFPGHVAKHIERVAAGRPAS